MHNIICSPFKALYVGSKIQYRNNKTENDIIIKQYS